MVAVVKGFAMGFGEELGRWESSTGELLTVLKCLATWKKKSRAEATGASRTARCCLVLSPLSLGPRVKRLRDKGRGAAQRSTRQRSSV